MESPQVPSDVLSTFRSTPLHVASLKERFLEQAQKDLAYAHSDSAMAADPRNPTLVDEEISAQVEFFKKTKFKFLEQEAKETFLKLILAEEPAQIDEDANDELEREVKASKATIKAAKVELEELRAEVERTAEDTTAGYSQLSRDVSEAEAILKEIREMELDLARLRTELPIADRLTTDEANQILDDQVNEIMSLTDTLETASSDVDATKRSISKLAKEVDRLGPERAKEEARVKSILASRSSEGEEVLRIESICKWYNSTIAMHKTLLSIESISSPKPHELELVYGLPKAATPTPASATSPARIVLRIILDPSTRALHDAMLIAPAPFALDVSEALALASPSNDVAGLVQDVGVRLSGVAAAAAVASA